MRALAAYSQQLRAADATRKPKQRGAAAADGLRWGEKRRMRRKKRRDKAYRRACSGKAKLPGPSPATVSSARYKARARALRLNRLAMFEAMGGVGLFLSHPSPFASAAGPAGSTTAGVAGASEGAAQVPTEATAAASTGKVSSRCACACTCILFYICICLGVLCRPGSFVTMICGGACVSEVTPPQAGGCVGVWRGRGSCCCVLELMDGLWRCLAWMISSPLSCHRHQYTHKTHNAVMD